MKSAALSVLCFFAIAPYAWSSSPVILNHTETVGNGDVMFVQGSGFDTSPVVEYAYNDTNWISASFITFGNGTVTFKIPGDETRLPDVLTVRVSNDRVNWSAPVFVNAPEASFINTDQIAASSSFQIFGRNLYFSRVPSVRLVDQADGSSQDATVDITTSQHYKLSVVAPAHVIAGHQYKVYVSNGYSGNASTPVESLVPEVLAGRAGGVDYWQLGLPWAADFNFYNNIYNIKQDARLNNIFATGNGVADDTWPIFHAIQVVAAAGGGVIYLPDGTYTLHFTNGCGIQLPPKVVLQGSGASKVTINYGYGAGTTGGFGACFNNLTGMADLTMNNVDLAQQWQYSALSSNNSEVFLKRVVWNIGTSQWLNFVSDNHVAIEDTTINQGTDSTFNYLGPLNLQACAHCQVTNSTIHFTVCGMLFDWATDLIFQNNQVIRNISVAPVASTVTHTIAANFVKNFAVMNNQFSSVGNALPTNNDGEVIVTEGGGAQRYDEFRGSVTSATSTTITDQGQSFLHSANTVSGIQVGIARLSIVSGNGLGQTRVVTGVSTDGTTLTIDQPWLVIPDANSHYATFDWSAENWFIVNNYLSGNFKGLEMFNASISNLLLESNTLIDSDGIMVSPDEAAAQSNAGALFNVINQLSIVGNNIVDQLGLRPAYIGLIPREDFQSSSFGTHILGATVKANNVATAFVPNVFNVPTSWDDYKVKTEGYLCDYFWQSPSMNYDTTAPPPLLANVFQNNFASGSNEAFYLNSGAVQTIISDSYLNNVGAAQLDLSLPGAISASQKTQIVEGLNLFPVGLASSTDLLQGTASYYGGQAIALGHHSGGLYSVGASGDNLNLFGRQLSGTTDVVAHVTLVPSTSAGGVLMMRESTNNKSALVSIALSQNAIVVNVRSSDGSSLQTTSYPFTGKAVWLRLRYFGGTTAALFSIDGKEWTQVNTAAVFTNQTYIAGIADLSPGNETGIETIFDGLAFTPIVAASPVSSSAKTSRR